MAAEFQHPAVRDLAWIIGSPPLLEAGEGLYHPDRITRRWCRLALHDRIPWLRRLDRKPAVLEAWLAARRSPLLGDYFEALIEFWLRHWPRVHFTASRVQVRATGRGIGEFDFLFYDRVRRQTVHWESAVKFFLRHRDRRGDYRWLGPNPRDTWDRKIGKIFQHQLRLAERSEAEPVLRRLGVERPRPEAFVKGYLFYPADSLWQVPEPIPPQAAADHLRGWWTRSGRRCIPQQAAASRWIVLERLCWLSPATSVGEAAMDRPALDRFVERHFSGSARPLLLAELAPCRHGYREISRGFVVPDTWPEEAG